MSQTEQLQQTVATTTSTTTGDRTMAVQTGMLGQGIVTYMLSNNFIILVILC